MPASADQPPPGSASAAATPDLSWQHALAAWLAAHKAYPTEARRRNLEGTAVIRFTADRSGRVLDVVLERSAGSAILDAAAEAMLRNAMIPPFTGEMSRDQITATVQIRFALAN